MARITIIAALLPLLVPFAGVAATHDVAARSHDALARRIGTEHAEIAKNKRGDDDYETWVFDDDWVAPARVADPFPEAENYTAILAATPEPEDDDEPEVGPQLEERKYYKKAAVPWPNAIPNGLKYLEGTNVFGMYTWSPYCPPQAKQYGIRCFPMFWGRKSIDEFKALVKRGYSDHVLGPNECNQMGESQLSPGAAAALWKEYIYPLRNKGYNLVSPSTSNAKSSIPWMKAYLKTCGEPCRSGKYAAHFYGTKSENFISYMTQMHNVTGGKLWVTETACQNFGEGKNCSPSEAKAYMSAITKWMEETSWIEMYGYFGFFAKSRAGVSQSNALMNENGSLNVMGKMYIH